MSLPYSGQYNASNLGKWGSRRCIAGAIKFWRNRGLNVQNSG